MLHYIQQKEIKGDTKMQFYKMVKSVRNHRNKAESECYKYWKKNNLIYKEKDNFVTVFTDENKNEICVVVFNK